MTPNMIGAYGPWAASLNSEAPGPLSFRNPAWTDIENWRQAARQKFLELLAQPDTGGVPKARVKEQYLFDGLHVEELEWQLPYGAPTQAIFLKPAGAAGKLPGIVALHDHAGRKYFGKRKITRTNEAWHPIMLQHHTEYYGGVAWANELAKRGYAVLVPDAFGFASRRVLLQDVPLQLQNGLNDDNPEAPENIEAYHRWAGAHESILAKSLFCAGTTWPGSSSFGSRR